MTSGPGHCPGLCEGFALHPPEADGSPGPRFLFLKKEVKGYGPLRRIERMPFGGQSPAGFS